MCVAGECGGMASCPAGTVDCGGECRDVSADPELCGSCMPAPCNASEYCADGMCACRPGLTRCGDVCVDTRSNRENCGMCGMVCEMGICVDGACAARDTCMAPLEVCGGACVDTETDVRNCGGCGDRCDVDQVCIEGNCEDYEPAPGCATCGGCDTCPMDAFCCDLAGYGATCLDTGVTCP
jgi:hypothetical protein